MNLDNKIEIQKEIENRIRLSHKRLDAYYKFVDKHGKFSAYDQGSYYAIEWALLNQPIICYAIGFNSSSIIELYGILEYYLIRHLSKEFHTVAVTNEAKLFLSNKGYSNPIKFFATKWLLRDIANIYQKMRIITKEEKNIVEEIINLRNSFAHKNTQSLSKFTKSNKPLSVFDIDNLKTMKTTDPKRYILMTGKILLKITERSQKLNPK